MNFLTDYRSVICHIESNEKERAIDEVIDKCAIFSDLPNRQEFRNLVRQREIIGTTGIGHGIAIAHGKLRKLSRIRIAMGISEDGIHYDSCDGEPVHLLFVIASSPTRQFEYIKSLSTLLKKVSRDDVRDELLQLNRSFDNCTNLSDDGDSVLHMLTNQHTSLLWNPRN